LTRACLKTWSRKNTWKIAFSCRWLVED